MAYILDANCFIEPANRYYGFQLCPGFWDALVKRNATGTIYSVSHVGEELRGHDDDLADWAKQQGDEFFLPDDDGLTVNAVQQIATWVNNSGFFKPQAKAEFLGCADPFIIAYAMTYNHTIVTHESLDLNARRSIKIPVVCQQFGVPWDDLFSALTSLGIRLVLA